MELIQSQKTIVPSFTERRIMIYYPVFITYEYFERKKCTCYTYKIIVFVLQYLLNLSITVFSRFTVNRDYTFLITLVM